MATIDGLAEFIAALLFFGIVIAVACLRLHAPRLLPDWPFAPFALFALSEVVTAQLPPFPQGGCTRVVTEGLSGGALLLFGVEVLRGRLAWRHRGIALGAALLLLAALCRFWRTEPLHAVVHRLFPLPAGSLAAYALYREEGRREEEPFAMPIWMMIAATLLVALLPLAEGLWPSLYPLGMAGSAALLFGGFGWLGLRRQAHMRVWLGEVERAQWLAAERERISRELHDGVIQAIYAAGLMVEGAKYEMERHPDRAMHHLAQVTATLDETIRDIRRYIFDLRGDVSGEALVPSLRKLLQEFEANTYLETTFRVINEPGGPLQRERQQHLYQIVREALSNVARHAHARSVTLTLVYSDEGIDIRIADDGVGMGRIPLNKGYGLRNIRERVRLLDGTMKIESAPGQGVTLHISVSYG